MSTAIKEIFPLDFPRKTQDPFLFCVYHLDHYPKGNDQMGPVASLEGRNLGNDFTIKDGWRMYHGQTVPGFPSHPHRGFETVTIVNKGFCDHSDSLGAAGRFGEGDVQWMTAGKGVQHAEMFPLLKKDQNNPLELFQIWLNLPKASKFVNPHFAMLWHEDIPVVNEEGVSIKIIAGHYKAVKALDPAPDSWAATAHNDVAIWNIHVEANTSFTLPISHQEVNRTLYFYEGNEIHVNGQHIQPDHGIALDASVSFTFTNGDKPSHFLLLQGKPLQEPVAKYGPFVMNTDKEIQQTMQEYRLTQFGGWPWPHTDNVHDREKGRFAQYPDGTIVKK